MRRRILVVDGHAPNRRLLKEILEKAGYEVTDVSCKTEALEVARSNPPDLISTEVLMPADGFGLLLDLKRDKMTCEIPVIMISAKAQDADILRAYEAGIGVYLTKPYNCLEVLAFIRRALSSESWSGEKRYDVAAHAYAL